MIIEYGIFIWNNITASKIKKYIYIYNTIQGGYAVKPVQNV